MEYVSRVLAPPLDGFIDDTYCLTGVPRHRRMNVPPMPSAHLFVNLGRPVRLWDSDPSVPPAVCTDGWFMGVWTRRFLIEYPTPVRVVGVHFKPWGISPFVDVPATELRDRWVPVDAVWKRSLDRIRNQIGETGSAAEMLRVLEEELRSRLAVAPSRGIDLVQRIGGLLEASTARSRSVEISVPAAVRELRLLARVDGEDAFSVDTPVDQSLSDGSGRSRTTLHVGSSCRGSASARHCSGSTPQEVSPRGSSPWHHQDERLSRRRSAWTRVTAFLRHPRRPGRFFAKVAATLIE